MPREGGYRRHRSASRDIASDREYERDRERRRRKAAHTSADSSAELLGSPYRDSPSPVKRGERSDSSPDKSRRYRRGEGDEDRDRERRRRERREERRREKEREEQRERERDRDNEVEVVEYPASSGVNSEMDRYAAREKMREERRRREKEERERDVNAEREREREARREEKRRRRREERRGETRDESRRRLVNDSETSGATPQTGSGGMLSAGSLAALDAINAKMGFSGGEQRVREEVDEKELRRREEQRRRKEEKRRTRHEDGYESARRGGPDPYDEYLAKEEKYEVDYQQGKAKRDKKSRVVSGQKLEKGGTVYDQGSVVSYRWWRRIGGGGGGSNGSDYTALSPEEEAQMRRRRKRFFITLAVIVIILAIAIPVGVVVSNQDSKPAAASSGSTTTGGKPANANLQGVDPNSVPATAKGTWLDPFSWYDTTDFNVTYTDEMVGGLPVIGLNSTWDDSTRANSNVPPLDQSWEYGKMPIRGINVGGWLVMEPLITPSFWSKFKTSDGVIDEYTLAAKLPPSSIKTTFETHYSAFLTEQDFKEMQAAGFDHVRIPYGYWAVATYPGDPYVANVSWRYLLRSIEWARKYGLRIKLDMHGAPGSQNGWNHSGKQGDIGWLNGTSGTENGQRTTDIHDRLSKFFAQPRYKNIVTIWGLVNEPKMTFLDTATVLQWTKSTVDVIRKNGITATIAFGDGFRGLDNWQGQLQDVPGLVLDVHQYVIFNVQQLILDHQAKVNFACGGWTAQAVRSMDKTTGFGATMFAEWSQADTDCAIYLNNVGVGSRWEGTLNFATGAGGGNGSVLTPTCPTNNNPRCSCREANADPNGYSAVYKQWLKEFAEAQMESFERGWGWFYWTWKTENNAQWSYRDGLKNGILPSKTWERSFSCGGGVPDYAALGLPEYY
ncbi:Cellulase-like protein 8 [Elsinoe fawcettii]|nr:Cellulase-like protein 8 [Elsinoe fawcettii]